MLQHVLLLVAFFMFLSYVQVAMAADQLPVNGLVIPDIDPENPVFLVADKNEIEMHISGNRNRATLRQVFHHHAPGKKFESLEKGVYVFSLDKSAILDSVEVLSDHVKTVVYPNKDTTYELDVVKHADRKFYQLRNMGFDLSNTVEIRVLYHQLIQRQQGKYELVIPMLDTGQTDLHIDLDAGFQAEEIISPTHAIHVVNHGAGRYSIRFQDSQINSKKDFKLYWVPETENSSVSSIDDPERTVQNNLPKNIQSARHIDHILNQPSEAGQLKIIIGLICFSLAWGLRLIISNYCSSRKFSLIGQPV